MLCLATHLLVLLIWILTLMPIPAHAADCSMLSERKTTRFPVVIKAPEWMYGISVDHVEAWAITGKKWRQVPLQIDEVNEDGNYVLEEGIPFTRNTDNGLLDRRDELSISGENLGDRFVRAAATSNFKGRFRSFRRVDFCSENGEFWGSLLIGHTEASATRISFKQLFSRPGANVDTAKYRYEFRASHPMLMGDVRIKSPGGDKPVFAGSSFVMPLIPRVIFFPTFNFAEGDFTSEIESWRSGPVRSIVAVGAKLRKFFSIIDLHLFSELVFYEDYFQIPTKIEFVFDPSSFFSPGSGLAYILKYPEGVDWELSSNLSELPGAGPRHDGNSETAYDKSSRGEFSVRGGSSLGSFVAKVRVDPKALRQAPPPYLASRASFKDPKIQKAWPWVRSSEGSLGVFIDISGVKRGTYDFALDVALSNQAHDDFTDFQAVSAIWPDPAAY